MTYFVSSPPGTRSSATDGHSVYPIGSSLYQDRMSLDVRGRNPVLIFAKWAFIGALVFTTALFLMGCWVGLIGSRSSVSFLDLGVMFCILPGLFVTPYVAMLSGALAIVVDCFFNKSASSIRRYLTAYLATAFIGLMLIPVWTFGMSIVNSQNSWTQKQIAFNKLFVQSQDFIVRPYFGPPTPVRAATPTQVEYVNLVNRYGWMCFFEACLNNAGPFLFGMPALVILLLCQWASISRFVVKNFRPTSEMTSQQSSFF